MKMLLVGDLNETLYSLNDYLMKDFQIQICSENVVNVKDMIRLYRPDIVLLIATAMNKDTQGILSLLSDKYNSLALVVLGVKEIRSELEVAMASLKNNKVLYRPIISSEVRKACMVLLDQESADSAKGESEENASKKQILVVDDNALVLRNVKSLLEQENYQVLLANSGEKALASVKKNQVDLILLDYEMPGMNGREVFEALISDDETKDIPVVFLTSIAERDQIYAVLKNIPFGYILKPPANEKILSVIKEALEA